MGSLRIAQYNETHAHNIDMASYYTLKFMAVCHFLNTAVLFSGRADLRSAKNPI